MVGIEPANFIKLVNVALTSLAGI